MKKRVVFLCSGNGGNLKCVHQYFESCESKIEIAMVISDRECRAIEYAENNNIPNQKVEYSDQGNLQLKSVLLESQPDLIVSNFQRIIDSEIVNCFRGKIINLHYSLLPAFGGTIGIQPIRDALNQGCKYIGTTVHEVDEKIDNGKVISQSIVPVLPDHTIGFLTEQVFRQGCLNLINAIYYFFSENESIDRKVNTQGGIFFNPPILFNISCFTDTFWDKIAKS